MSALQNARNLRASIQASEATMKLAGRQLRDTDIRAPFDGYVERRLVNLGELVKSQMPVMAIVRLDPLKVTAEIPEKMAPWISDGRPVELHVDAYRDRTFTGKVTRISPAVNTATRAFPVRGRRAERRRGAQARHVRPRPRRERQGRRRAHAAVSRRCSTATASTACSSSTAIGWPSRELQVGERLGDRIEIVSGVKEGERVAVDRRRHARRRHGRSSVSRSPSNRGSACSLNSASAGPSPPRCS